MKKSFSFCLLFSVLGLCASAAAEAALELHVVKSTINSESENAELCLQFDKPLSSTSPARLAANLKLEAGGEIVNPSNIAAADSSLCLFPLEREKLYRLSIKESKGTGETKKIAPYKLSFSIPDRSPSLAFTGKNEGTNDFGSYDHPLILRAVNVPRAKLEVHRIADPALMASVWQNRAQMALVPTESAYIARTKGKTIWREEATFEDIKNATGELKISLKEKLADLAPGLYLIIAESEKNDKQKAAKGLAPLAAAWFVKSEFTLHAVRDDSGIYAFSSTGTTGLPKSGVRLEAYGQNAARKAEAQSGADGIGRLRHASDRGRDDIKTIIALDSKGNVAFADIKDLPEVSGNASSGSLRIPQAFVAPLAAVEASMDMPVSEKGARSKAMTLRILSGDAVYADIPVPSASSEAAKISFIAPAKQGVWDLQLREADGAVLAKEKLYVSTNPEAPRLEVTTERDSLQEDASWPMAIKSTTASGKPASLVSGRIYIGWQKLDAEAHGWQGFTFGNPSALLPAETHVADFVTDLNGAAQIHLNLPHRPQEAGLYQAVLKVVSEPDAGVMDAPALHVPLRPQGVVIGIKPLTPHARFSQNGLARFALIGLSSDGKPRDVADLSFQIYEEGRSFEWYQSEGRWNYKPEAQLRPIGGGAISVKSDGSSILEWPVNAGNYRIEILDKNGKTLAQSAFSAGWNAKNTPMEAALPLKITLPKTLMPGREAKALVTLPKPSMLTVIVAETRIRHVIHEFRQKGANAISFSPAPDWGKTLSLTVTALPQGGGEILHASAQTHIAEGPEKIPASRQGTTKLLVPFDPSTLALRKNDQAALTFGIQNNEPASQIYRYAFTASSGLKIKSGAEGKITLGANESASLPLVVSALTAGAKELRLELTGSPMPRLVRAWPLAVFPDESGFRSMETLVLKPQQSLKQGQSKARTEGTVLFSRRSLDGVMEILSYVFHADPFTTEELALVIEALESWEEPLKQTGMAPDFALAAKRQSQTLQLLRRQNADGGFGPYRGSGSTLEDTAAALTALSALPSDQTAPAKNLAVNWLKQRLSNTWFEEKERDSRAAAYAAMAKANAIDPASLHYFSDISSTNPLSPVAEANMAAAFKRMKEPDAAAFWIKKMISENGKLQTAPVLKALAATDALSSDDVLAATAEMAQSLQGNSAPALKDAAALLSAIAAHGTTAGKANLSIGRGSRSFTGVFVAKGTEAALQAYRNDGPEPLYATFVSQAKPKLLQGASLERHIYRLNGVEVLPPAKPVSGEIYLIGLEGTVPAGTKGKPFIVQDGGNGMRPKACPLSKQLNALSFIPWFTTGTLTKVDSCEYSGHTIGFVVMPDDHDGAKISVAYFAHVDAESVSELPAPILRSAE